MAAPNTKTMSDIKTETTIERPAEIPALAQKFREQLVSTVKQGQQLSLDAARTWFTAVSVLPMPNMPNIPGIPALPGMEAAPRYVFDLASDLLSAQREFALRPTSVIPPSTEG